MAEFRKLPTQEELQKMLYMGQLQGKSNEDIINENLASGTTIKALPENFFATAGAGAKQAEQFVNKAGTAQDLAKLFPGYTGQTKVSIPTSFNFAPKMDPYSGQAMPSGLQTQQIPYGDILKAIKPADVLGLTGTQQAYSDIGAGKAPNPMDVLDVVGLGAAGLGAGKGLLSTAKVAKGLPIGLSIEDVSKAGLLATAPKSDIGFYSAVEQAAMASPRKSAPGQAFLNDIMKGQDVRADEIKWMGLDDYLKDKKNITKQEVQDYIANNRVDVQEVKSTIPRLPGEKMPGDKGAFLPKFAQYQLPGGENYRELLLTMPAKKLTDTEVMSISRDKDRYIELSDLRRPLSADERSEWDTLAKKIEKEDLNYRSSHFPGQPNILAHLRVNDRVDADGKKMLLIEEVQSDWHQTGREKGYKGDKLGEKLSTEEYNKGLNLQRREINNEVLTPEEKIELQQLRSRMAQSIDIGKVPNAPFKDTWYQLALKRAIQHAAENGYDRIGLTTGSRQAERFDLSKQIDSIKYNAMPDGRIFWTAEKNGERVTGGDNAPNELDSVVGKEVAQRIREGAATGKPGKLSGIDLQVGGEGMKKYYDEIYPKFLDKYGKKWNAKLGETKVNTVMEANPGSMIPRMGNEPVRYIDITPEMKAGVSKGQPLFQAAPIAAGGGLLGSQQDQRK